VVKKILTAFLFLIPIILSAQQSEDELRIDMNTYIDNFDVKVVYPTINFTKKLDDNTSVSAGYLVDAIAAASMKMSFKVDGITSATPNTQGVNNLVIDDIRHQFTAGINRSIKDINFSLNGIFSTEHDYSSKTIAGSISIPFAKKNTVFQFGYTGSRDKIFPITRTWTKDKNTTSLNLGMTQILAKNVISQLDFSYSDVNGYMLDGYQVVRIIHGSNFMTLEPIEPDTRIRKAAGMRTNIGITRLSTMQLGYRYYWDSWDVTSHTIEAAYKTHVSDDLNLSFDFRQYFQTKAFFFKPVYTQPETFMSVDSKLNSGNSNDLTVELTLNGNPEYNFPIINNKKVTLITSLGIYHRHTDSPDWSSRLSELYAYVFSIGVKISI